MYIKENSKSWYIHNRIESDILWNCSQNDETLPRVIRKQKISPKDRRREEPCRQMCVIQTITIWQANSNFEGSDERCDRKIPSIMFYDQVSLSISNTLALPNQDTMGFNLNKTFSGWHQWNQTHFQRGRG